MSSITEIERVQRNFAKMLITLHNTNKTDEIQDFGLLMLMTGSIMGDLDLVSTAMDNYPESADPLRPATPKIISILSQLKLLDFQPSTQLETNRPESPTSITEINIQDN
tara:strand:+ start:319 stop:645 length:327 start_codon:yes stop_codon:yes gene_type:complete